MRIGNPSSRCRSLATWPTGPPANSAVTTTMPSALPMASILHAVPSPAAHPGGEGTVQLETTCVERAENQIGAVAGLIGEPPADFVVVVVHFMGVARVVR